MSMLLICAYTFLLICYVLTTSQSPFTILSPWPPYRNLNRLLGDRRDLCTRKHKLMSEEKITITSQSCCDSPNHYPVYVLDPLATNSTIVLLSLLSVTNSHMVTSIYSVVQNRRRKNTNPDRHTILNVLVVSNLSLYFLPPSFWNFGTNILQLTQLDIYTPMDMKCIFS